MPHSEHAAHALLALLTCPLCRLQFKERWIEDVESRKTAELEKQKTGGDRPRGTATHMPIFCHLPGSARVKMQPNCRGSNFYEPQRCTRTSGILAMPARLTIPAQL